MQLAKRIEAVEELLGYSFQNKELLAAAITHPSAAEHDVIGSSYQRLEFLGDSILGAIVAFELFSRFPDRDEGELTLMKVALVSGETLSQVAESLGLAELIVVGESVRGTGLRGMRSVLEDVFEALVGALYLEAGIQKAQDFVLAHLSELMEEDAVKNLEPPKSLLQQYTQRDLHQTPVYKLVEQSGPAHSPTFTSVVLVGGIRKGRGTGLSKKESEAQAAHDALKRMGYL